MLKIKSMLHSLKEINKTVLSYLCILISNAIHNIKTNNIFFITIKMNWENKREFEEERI